MKSEAISVAQLPSHNHSINHDHGSITSGAGTAHSHAPANGGKFIQGPSNATTVLSILGSNPSGSSYGFLAYDSDLADTPTDSATATEAAHTHTVDMPSFTGTSDNTGSGTARSNLQPYLVMNYVIKAS